MSDHQNMPENQAQPIFNVHRAVVWLIAIMAGIHALRVYVLDQSQNIELIERFAFIPQLIANQPYRSENPLVLLTPLTHGFLHADWMHMLFNGFWLLAFGGVCAARLGGTRFLILFASGVLGGALFQVLMSETNNLIMIGASAGVSACFGAATRFALSFKGEGRQKLLSLVEVWSDRTALSFIAIWFVTNLVFGSNFLSLILPGSGSFFGADGAQIAWQAHIGGFVVGLFLIAVLDWTRPHKNEPQA